MDNRTMMERDLKHLWHPCTQMKDHETLPIIPIERGEGVYLYDFDGNRYIDAVSSWWVNIFGHCNSYINGKIVRITSYNVCYTKLLRDISILPTLATEPLLLPKLYAPHPVITSYSIHYTKLYEVGI